MPSYTCPIALAECLEARTDWAAQQRADTTISRVVQLLNANARPDVNKLEANSSLKSLVDVWSKLVVENAILKHCNERVISTRIVVFAVLREEVFRALHEPAHHCYQATLRRIAQRIWWPHVGTVVLAVVRSCLVCNRDRNANPSPRAPFGYRSADQPFATLYIDIVDGQGSLSLGPSPKSILSMIDGLKG